MQLVHTLSIYGQINVPICELNRIYGLTSNLGGSRKTKSVGKRATDMDIQDQEAEHKQQRRFREKQN